MSALGVTDETLPAADIGKAMEPEEEDRLGTITGFLSRRPARQVFASCVLMCSTDGVRFLLRPVGLSPKGSDSLTPACCRGLIGAVMVSEDEEARFTGGVAWTVVAGVVGD